MENRQGLLNQLYERVKMNSNKYQHIVITQEVVYIASIKQMRYEQAKKKLGEYIERYSSPYTSYDVTKWQDTPNWWREIIRIPEWLLPQGPKIIFTTNCKDKWTIVKRNVTARAYRRYRAF